jgi:hypothetical protein
MFPASVKGERFALIVLHLFALEATRAYNGLYDLRRAHVEPRGRVPATHGWRSHSDRGVEKNERDYYERVPRTFSSPMDEERRTEGQGERRLHQ